METLLECDTCSLDVKLLESHARIVQAFLATGERFNHITETGPHLPVKVSKRDCAERLDGSIKFPPIDRMPTRSASKTSSTSCTIN